MINITNYTLFGKDGILIKYDNDKNIFFTENEAEEIGDFLNKRENNLRNRILAVLETKNMSLGDLIKELNVDRDIINEELIKLENEDRICNEKKRVEHGDMGTLFISVFKKKE